MTSTAAEHARRPGLVLGCDDRIGVDAAARLPSLPASRRGLRRKSAGAARAGVARSGPHNLDPAQPQLCCAAAQDSSERPLHLVIDSTRLKLFGQGEWDEEKHGRTRRSWCKLHLAVHAGTDEIVASLLTDNAADDAGQLP